MNGAIKGFAVAIFASACGVGGQASNATSADPSSTLTPQEIVDRAAGGGDSFLPDFSYAGYGFGSSELPRATGRVISPDDFGATPDDGKDDSKALQAALDAARKANGPVVIRFSPGRYHISEIIDIDRSDLVLQGAGRGEGGTEIYFPRPMAMVDTGTRFDEIREYLVRYEKRQRSKDENYDFLFSEYSWTGAFFWVGRQGARAVPYLEELDKRTPVAAKGTTGQRGERSIAVDNAAAFQVGQWIDIMWYSDDPDSGIIDSIYGDTDLEVGSHHWTFENRPLVRHRTKVTAIDRNSIEIASPLPHSIGEDIPADIALWTPLERVGIEEMRFSFPNAPAFGHHLERGYNAIYFTGAADGWVRNVAINNADAGILTDDAAHLTLTDLEFTGSRMAHYAVHMGSVGSVLAQNLNIDVPIKHSLTFNTKSVRSVYKNATVHHVPVIDQHAGSNHQNLYDSIVLHLSAEEIDGKPSYKVFDGSGAPYWQPGHGRYNTVWNLKLIVEGGAAPDDTLAVLGLAEGPDARIVGLHANREVTLDYRPEPLVSHLGARVHHIPSLYDAQRLARQEQATNP